MWGGLRRHAATRPRPATWGHGSSSRPPTRLRWRPASTSRARCVSRRCWTAGGCGGQSFAATPEPGPCDPLLQHSRPGPPRRRARRPGRPASGLDHVASACETLDGVAACSSPTGRQRRTLPQRRPVDAARRPRRAACTARARRSTPSSLAGTSRSRRWTTGCGAGASASCSTGRRPAGPCWCWWAATRKPGNGRRRAWARSTRRARRTPGAATASSRKAWTPSTPACGPRCTASARTEPPSCAAPRTTPAQRATWTTTPATS